MTRAPRRCIALALLLLVIMPRVAPAQNLKHWVNEGRLTRDWAGLRPKLEDRGLTVTFQYWTNFAGNPVGGESHGLTYTDQTTMSIDLDMQKLVGWTGGQFHLVLNNRLGKSLTNDHIGNLFNVQQLYGPTERFRLSELSVEQSLFGGKLNIRGGRYPNDEFGTSPYYCLFQNQAICGYPGIGPNVNLAYFPVATWSGRVKVAPRPSWYVMGGIWDVNPDNSTSSGFDWSLSGSTGAAVGGEVGYLTGLDADGKAGRYPGHYKIGSYYNSSPAVAPATEKKAGLYIEGDQTVWAGQAGEGTVGVPPGVTLIGGYIWGNREGSPYQSFMFGGVVVNGLLGFRPHDTQGVEFSWAHSSPQLAAPGVTSEYQVELHYGFQVNRWFTAQPNIQWVIRPGGAGTIPNALVFGLQTVIDF